MITYSFPDNWIPNTVILEGMFLINTKPLHAYKTVSEYGMFIMRRFIVATLPLDRLPGSTPAIGSARTTSEFESL